MARMKCRQYLVSSDLSAFYAQPDSCSLIRSNRVFTGIMVTQLANKNSYEEASADAQIEI